MRIPALAVRRSFAAVLGGWLALAAPSLAGEADWVELEAWLARIEAGEAGPAPGPVLGRFVPLGPQAGRQAGELAPAFLSRLMQRHTARLAQFEAASTRDLPLKARERLERAREAYESGQGRLVRIVTELARRLARPDAAGLTRGDVAPGPPADELRAAAAEAREIVERLALASRRQPLSGELKVRAPQLRPPALAPPAGVASSARREPLVDAEAWLTSAPIGAIPEGLRQLADQLDSPLAVYEYVRNLVAPELYFGAMKGPLQTQLEASGNDADTASLLVALLRAKGVPARYARGTVTVEAARLRAFTGASTTELAVRALERAGIPHEVVPGPGGIAAVKMGRVWVEAYVPYANYRGAPLDAQGKVWLPLDPGFKELEPPSGVRIGADLGLASDALADEYLAGVRTDTPLDFVRERVTERMVERGKTYADALNRRGLVPEHLGLLPNVLPSLAEGQPERSFDVPDDLRHDVRLRGDRDGVSLLDARLPLADLMGRRLTLSYVPFDEDDARTVAEFGGLSKTPPYLVEVKAVLKSGGVGIAAGEQAVGAGVLFDLRIELVHPGGTEVIENSVLAGNLTAIGLGDRDGTGQEAGSSHAAAILARVAFRFLDRWNRADAELAQLLRVIPVRPTASACMVMSEIEVEYAGGDPLYPVTFEWKGVAIDADLRSSAPGGVEDPGTERDFLLLSGLEGSALEGRVLEEVLGVDSVSTAEALQLAAAGGIPVLELTRDNVEDELSRLTLDPVVEEEVRNGAGRGFTVRLPAEAVSHLAWTGVGYRILDPASGEAAYQLHGGHSGGVTTAPTLEWPLDLRETLVDQGEEPAPEGSAVHSIAKFLSTDFQEGFVDTPLERAFRVLATDENGLRVAGAAVTFVVVGGGGSLLDPVTGTPAGSQVTVRADPRGEAEARLVLGKSTREIPRFTCLLAVECSNETETYATQVGLNLVTAHAGTAQLAEPFFAFGKPDNRSETPGQQRAFLRIVHGFDERGIDNLRVTTLLSLDVNDQHGNPISNFPTRFAFRPPPVLGTPPPGWVVARGATTTPGKLLKLRDFRACSERTGVVRWGECPGESEVQLVPSSARGAVVYPVAGDSPYSGYTFDIGSDLEPNVFWIVYGTWGRLCSPSCGESALQPILFPEVQTRPVLVNNNGDLIEAYPPGGEATLGLSTDVVYEGHYLEKFEDADGTVHWRARGDNTWTREPLEDSQFDLRPATPGTGVGSGAAGHVGGGVYESRVTMGGTPQLNTVEFDYRLFPLEIPYDPGKWPDVDPRFVDQVNLKAVRQKFYDRPWTGQGDFSLWGVRPEITAVTPSPILLSEASTVEGDHTVLYQIEPQGFQVAVPANQVFFVLRKGGEVVAATGGGDGTPFTIPRGLKLEPGVHEAFLEISGVWPEGDLRSAPFPVHVMRSLDLDVDADRDGVVDDDRDEAGEADWTKARGAIFSVNLDRDGTRSAGGVPIPDALDFNDSGLPVQEDSRIENEADALDVTPMVLGGLGAPLPPGVQVFITVAEQEDIQSVHVFKAIAAGETSIWGSLGDRVPGGTAEPLEKDITALVDPASPAFAGAGPKDDVTFGVERLFFRNLGVRNSFDGELDFTVELRKDGAVLSSDSVRLKVAPWMMLPHTQPSTEMWAADFGAVSAAFLGGLAPSGQLSTVSRSESMFSQWLQDQVETGYYQRPGGPRTLGTFRLPYFRGGPPQPPWPQTELLRPDAATFQYGLDLGPDTGGSALGSGNYGGNIEVLPPTPAHPLGRIAVGDTRSSDLRTLFESQEVQPPVDVPARWLAVGHFDEMFAFLPTPGQVAMGDPADAYEIMEKIPPDERGRAVFFATGGALPQTGLVAAPPSAPNRLETGIDLTGTTWKYVRIYRDTGSGAAGQVAHIAAKGNGFLLVDKVWNVGSKVVPSPGQLESIYFYMKEKAPVSPALGSPPGSPAGWFAPPRAGDRYVLVEGTQFWVDEDEPVETPAILTVEELLRDRNLRDLNTLDAQGQIVAARGILQAAAGGGLSFVSVPVIYVGVRTGFFPGFDFTTGRASVAFTPGLANLQVAGTSLYFPRQFGPRATTGEDLFETVTRSRLAGAQFVDDWDLYHRLDGEVHCGTTVVRTPAALDWWDNQPED